MASVCLLLGEVTTKGRAGLLDGGWDLPGTWASGGLLVGVLGPQAAELSLS